MIKGIKEAGNVKGKKVLLRLDLNMPIQNGVITDEYRLNRTLPTLRYLTQEGAKTVIIAHLENKENAATLKIVAEALKLYFPITFAEDVYADSARKVVDELVDGGIVLFENLRNWEGEKKNDEEFAKHLASFAEIYINDAFSVSHRKHASIVGLPKLLPSYAGPLFQEEVKNLSVAFNPPRPFVFVLGGAKFDTKLPLITKFLTIADHVFVGGALVNNLLKEKGFNVGKSLVSEGEFNLKDLINNQKLILPVDVVVERNGEKVTVPITEVQDDDVSGDVGPETIKSLENVIDSAGCILWNGPLGNFEKGFSAATLSLAGMIGHTSAHTILGGGDTLAAISQLKVEDKCTFVSTGGGAMLDFLANETLPGIKALEEGK